MIPFEKKGTPPAVEDLQMLTNSERRYILSLKIILSLFEEFCLTGQICAPPPQTSSAVLFAMKEDSEKVPALLTDYILKGERHAFTASLTTT